MRRTRNPANRRTAAQMHALVAVRRDIRSHGLTGPRKYLQEFNQAFRKYERTLSVEELEARIAAASIVLVGDYHSLPASQQFAANLVERTASSRRVVLGVEAILTRDQAVLDQWWRREISEAELRERVRFDSEWGYNWQPFYDLLASARDRADGIYGLDCLPRHDMRRISSRDGHAAQKIAEMRGHHPKALMVVLFGESHLAPEHLPHRLAQALPGEKILTILQNIDPVYWQAVDENATAVSLGESAVCVFNSTPLEKYESYRLCLEKWRGDDTPDFTPVIHNLILSLARALGFKANSPHNGTQPKGLADSLPEVAYLADHESAPLDARARAMLEEGGCFYAPQSNTFFIREFRISDVAAEAARFLHHACKGMPQNYTGTERETMLSHFSSRLLCPKNLRNDGAHLAGEALYHDYVTGRVTRAAVRRMFLGRNS